MIRDLDRVVLTTALPEEGLEAGDIGTVVLVHRDSKGYEVEFTTLDGNTFAVVTVFAGQIRPTQARELAHARMVS